MVGWNRFVTDCVQWRGRGSMERSGVSTMRVWAAGVVGVMLLVSGCGGTTDGAPTAAPSTTSAIAASASTEAWDPCTIPDEAIEAAGLAVETKKATLIGERPISPDWSTCFLEESAPRIVVPPRRLLVRVFVGLSARRGTVRAIHRGRRVRRPAVSTQDQVRRSQLRHCNRARQRRYLLDARWSCSNRVPR